jgi:hypothetical protein
MAVQINGKIPEAWERAMQRAAEERLRCFRLDHDRFAVASTRYAPGTYHEVTVDGSGHISGCSNCPGWRGRQHPCRHAGAVARRLLREQGARPPKSEPVSRDSGVVESARTTRRQLFRTEAA